MKKRWIFTILLFVLSMLSLLISEAFAKEKAEKKEDIFPVISVISVEVKKDVSVKEFYDTNSLIRSRMFYEDFLKRFAKVNNMTEGGLDVLPVGIYFIPIDSVFFKNTKTGIYPVMTINAEPGMTLDEFYRTNSLINRKLSWNFFLERFAEFREIPNKETEFRKLKPGAWFVPIPMVQYWTQEGIKSAAELGFTQAKGGLYKAKTKIIALKEAVGKVEPVKEKRINLATAIGLVVLIFSVSFFTIKIIIQKFFH